jgi:hypothetical protein
MTRSMTRMALAGCLALAAMGAVAVLDVGSSTAEAAPSVSRFAGTYMTGILGWLPVTISDAGRIAGSSPYGDESVDGRVRDDGSYSYTVTWYSYGDDPRGRVNYPRTKYTYKSAGVMALDAVGNILGTQDDGSSFVWLRQ